MCCFFYFGYFVFVLRAFAFIACLSYFRGCTVTVQVLWYAKNPPKAGWVFTASSWNVSYGLAKGVLLKFSTPSLAPTDSLVAGVPGTGLTACAVCDSAKQAKRSGTSRKTPANARHAIGPLTQPITADLRCDVAFMSSFLRFVFL